MTEDLLIGYYHANISITFLQLQVQSFPLSSFNVRVHEINLDGAVSSPPC